MMMRIWAWIILVMMCVVPMVSLAQEVTPDFQVPVRAAAADLSQRLGMTFTDRTINWTYRSGSSGNCEAGAPIDFTVTLYAVGQAWVYRVSADGSRVVLCNADVLVTLTAIPSATLPLPVPSPTPTALPTLPPPPPPSPTVTVLPTALPVLPTATPPRGKQQGVLLGSFSLPTATPAP
jgi:hypothetical protein